jgi:carbamoyltransferase
VATVGIHDGHNASVVLHANGEFKFAVQEERIRRTKNFVGFPRMALEQLLANATEELEEIAVSSHVLGELPDGDQREALLRVFKRQDQNIGHLRVRAALSSAPGISILRDASVRTRAAKRRTSIKAALTAAGFAGVPVKFFDHHECHAASAYHGLAQDDDEYLVLTLDGGGDRLSSTVSVGRAGQLERIAATDDANSIGHIYSRTTFMMGMVPWEHEYKLMGMAPYAEAKRTEDVAKIFRSYLGLSSANPLTFKRLIPEPTNLIAHRLFSDLRGVRFDLIAGGLQKFTEELLLDWIRRCVETTGIRRVLCAGGVFMNVKANGVVLLDESIETLGVFPSCGDETLPFGACYLAQRSKGERTSPLSSIYLGTRIDAEAVRPSLDRARELGLEVSESTDVARDVAEILARGEIVARASGAMEFGARSLGNRSILADPKNPDIVRIINMMVKKRDFWMPFAPVVRAENMRKYFEVEDGVESPYMMIACGTTALRADLMAAVHSADLSARPQTVRREQNPGYYDILEAFEELTGRGVLLNTSFNLHGSPIVNDADDALDVLMNSGLNVLVMDRYIFRKNPRLE